MKNKSFEELAKECAEHGARFKKGYLKLALGNLCFGSLFIGVAAAMIALLPLAKTPWWMAAIIIVVYGGGGIFMLKQAKEDRDEAGRIFDEWMVRREELLDLAKKYKEWQ